MEKPDDITRLIAAILAAELDAANGRMNDA